MVLKKIPTFILASNSAFRAAALQKLRLTFEIDAANLDEESYQAESAEMLACILAKEKARTVAMRHPTKLILAADTLIVDMQNGKERIFGKPRNISHAKEILQALSGHTHKVITALCLYDLNTAEKYIVDYEITNVTFKNLSEKTIEEYLQSNEWVSKAGAYGVQGKARELLIDKISGNEDNVGGLPIALLRILFNKAGYKLKPE